MQNKRKLEKRVNETQKEQTECAVAEQTINTSKDLCVMEKNVFEMSITDNACRVHYRAIDTYEKMRKFFNYTFNNLSKQGEVRKYESNDETGYKKVVFSIKDRDIELWFIPIFPLGVDTIEDLDNALDDLSNYLNNKN